MKLKKIMFLTIFSSALGQNTLSATTEPSQVAKTKTQGISRARKVFGGFVATAVATAGFFAGVLCGEEIREALPKLFKNTEKKTASIDTQTEHGEESLTAKEFDFIQAYGISRKNKKLYTTFSNKKYELLGVGRALYFNYYDTELSLNVRVYLGSEKCIYYVSFPVTNADGKECYFPPFLHIVTCSQELLLYEDLPKVLRDDEFNKERDRLASEGKYFVN